MGAPWGGGDAVLAAVAFATERLLGAEAWPERLDEVLAHLGAAAGADRVTCYQNVRDPDGRLWMDLCAEWDAPGVPQVFEDPGNHLHPFAPHFVRWIEVLSHGGLVNAIVGELPDPRAGSARERARGVGAGRSGAERRGMVGVPGVRRLSSSAPMDRERDRRAPGGGRGARGGAGTRSRRRDAAVHGGAVPLDGRTRTRGDLHRRVPTRRRRRSSSARRSRSSSGTPRRSGRRTPICGRACSIPTTGPARSPRTSGTTRRASRSASSTGCSTRTVTSSGCTTRPRSCATSAACPGSRTA